MTEDSSMLLQLQDLIISYGPIEVVRNLSLHVNKGEIVGLLGRNGAGKSSTLKAVAGLIPAKSGQIKFGGEVLSSEKVHQRVNRGIAIVPEGRWILSPLSVGDNLRLSERRKQSENRFTFEHVFELFPVLFDRKNQDAGSLSGGEQQMLALARALMTNPSLILLDEPSMGLSPLMTDRVLESVLKVNQLGVAILLVEQDVAIAGAITDFCYVIHQGEILMDRTSSADLSVSTIELGYLK